MIFFTPQMRIFVALAGVDLRKGFDALAAYCRDELEYDPFSGVVFVFTNRTRTHLRLLYYDSQGLWLCTKRLSKGRFPWWPRADASEKMRQLSAQQMQFLIWGGNGDRLDIIEPWRKIA